jgi:hypothetical protein
MDKLKVHIDSHLIKSTTSVPDELKGLGVQAYNENEFEQGVLLQVDLQLAEYELNKIKDKIKQIGADGDVEFLDDNDESTNNEQTTNEIKDSKKRKNEKYFEQYQEKKLRLESKFEDLNNYMFQSNQHNEDNDSNLTISSSNSKDNENLIKSGEMTPFGTRLYSDTNKPSTSKAASLVKTSSKQMKLTDFDKFTSSPLNNKKVVKTPSKSEISKNKKPTNKFSKVEPTDFEKFLGEVVQEPKKSKFNRLSTTTADTVIKPPPPSASNSSITIKKIISKENEISDFDKFLSQAECKVVTTIEKKKKEIKSKPIENKPISKKEEKKVEKKFVNKNQEIKPSDEVISFMKIFEEDENDDVNSVNLDLETDNIISNVKRTIIEDEESTSIENNDDENDDDDDDVVDDEITDIIEDTNEIISSDVDYDSDDSVNDTKKKNLRNCNDDGDEELFLKRLKKLDRIEKELQKNQSNNEPEYVEFEGGIRVPNRIWSKLYKFQKIGVKWFWELHNQRNYNLSF